MSVQKQFFLNVYFNAGLLSTDISDVACWSVRNSKALKRVTLTVYMMTEASGRTERIKQKKLIGINVKSYIWTQKWAVQTQDMEGLT